MSKRPTKKKRHWHRYTCGCCMKSVSKDDFVAHKKWREDEEEMWWPHGFCKACVWSALHLYISGKAEDSNHLPKVKGAQPLRCFLCISAVECFIVSEAHVEILPLMITLPWLTSAGYEYKKRLENL
ncbi:MAG: hypothetical protein GF334_10965 [Candidatus Altiarchaeales archaeon]|nr:hypothetical protein [Candidatus Altiarchaeales archaeon]